MSATYNHKCLTASCANVPFSFTVARMGTVQLRDLWDFVRHDANVEVRCRRCDHTARFDSMKLVEHFRSRGRSTSLDVVPYRFRCTGCGSSDASVRAYPKPKPPPNPLPDAPMGIDPAAWAGADERERKRLIRQARG